jgi:hypothetical protein
VLGYDIIIAMGADNIVGQDQVDSNIDMIKDSRLFQLGYIGSNVTNRPFQAYDPLHHILSATSNTVGPVMSFARHYMKNHLANGRKVLVVPCGQSDSGFSDGKWNAPNGSLYTTALNRTKVALAFDELINPLPIATNKANPNNKVVAALWVGGMKDVSYANFVTDLNTMVVSLRQDTSNTTIPFVYGQFAPEWIAQDSVTRTQFNNNLKNLSQTLPFSKSADTFHPFQLTSKAAAPQHFNAQSSRELGRRLFAAYHSIINNTTGVQSTFSSNPTLSTYTAINANDARVGINFSLNSNVHYVHISYDSNILPNVITSPYTISNLTQGSPYTFNITPGNLYTGYNSNAVVSLSITA